MSKIRPIQRIQKVLEALEKAYPDAHCELHHSNALELLMATILSAQCTDVRVNIVTKKLFQRCVTPEDYISIPLQELESIIQSTGFFRAKARHLKDCAQALLKNHSGEVPASLEALVKLPGVGRKTANVVLGDAFGTPEGVVVDTHVQRLAGRLGLSFEKTPDKIERDLMALVPRPKWAVLSHWLIWHGRRRCDARRPDCSECELRSLCPSAGDGASQVARKPAKLQKTRSKQDIPMPKAGTRMTPKAKPSGKAKTRTPKPGEFPAP